MKRKVRGSISDSSQASRARAVDERGLSSIIDMKPSASFAPMVSITLSPIIMSMTPDCTIYMHSPASPLLKTTPPGDTLMVAPALLAKARMSISARFCQKCRGHHQGVARRRGLQQRRGRRVHVYRAVGRHRHDDRRQGDRDHRGERGARLHVDDRRQAALVDRAGARGLRAVADRAAHLPLHGGRGAELRDLHHGRAGAAHPRHEPGDVTFYLRMILPENRFPLFGIVRYGTMPTGSAAAWAAMAPAVVNQTLSSARPAMCASARLRCLKRCGGPTM